MKTVISPSILSADFADMGNAVRRLEQCGADWVHCDVMDGVFVPNITFGQKMVSDISGLTDLVTDVHLMITEPIRYVEEFVRCGADIVTFHVEAAQNVAQTIAAIKKAGAKAGLALKPATPGRRRRAVYRRFGYDIGYERGTRLRRAELYALRIGQNTPCKKIGGDTQHKNTG